VAQDESLIEEMRKTLRSDRERAGGRRRGVLAAEPAPVAAPEPEPRRPGLLARLTRLQRRD